MPATPSKNYVVFSEVKKAISMLQVLEHYGLLQDFEHKGERLLGCCPLHKGTTPNQFKIDLEKNAWYCFGQCRTGGNILDFVARMEKVSIREAALLLADWFNLKSNGAGERTPPETAPDKPKAPPEAKERANNAPLGFGGLKNLEPAHSFLRDHGFDQETVKTFEAGYFAGEGVMKGRLAIPIHTPAGVLVGYAGRSLTQEAQYKFPRRFRPELELYNIHRAATARNLLREGLYIVKDCLDVWRLNQARIDNAVARLSDSLSPAQVAILKATVTTRAKIIWVAQEGERPEDWLALAQHFFVRVLMLPQPLWQISPAELDTLLN